MPKNIPSLRPKQLIKLSEQGGCEFHREGKGDHETAHLLRSPKNAACLLEALEETDRHPLHY
jgi:hypothetical protein